LIATQASHGPTTYEAYLATRRAPSKDDLEPPTCRESCCPCLPKARPPPDPVQFTRDLRVCGVLVTYRHGYFRRSSCLYIISGVQAQDNKNDNA